MRLVFNRRKAPRAAAGFGVAWLAAVLLAVFAVEAAAADTPNCTASDAPICEAKAKNKRPAKDEPPSEHQRALLQEGIAALAPQRKGVTDIYTIGVAGWANQDVFVKELGGAFDSMAKVLPTSNRVLRLINHPSTSQTPLATRANLAFAVQSVGKIMDKNEDVLVLFMTSHGTREGFALQLPWDRPVLLPPADVANILASAGIKNRVVIVSACYSGIFVKPVANDNTIVMTAADATHTSFGCAADRDWTYFGDAFFNRSLVPGVDFHQAFDSARKLIREWEINEKLEPSNPQGRFGRALVDRLAPVFAAGAGH